MYNCCTLDKPLASLSTCNLEPVASDDKSTAFTHLISDSFRKESNRSSIDYDMPVYVLLTFGKIIGQTNQLQHARLRATYF